MVSLLLVVLGFAAAQGGIAPDDGTFIYAKDGKEFGQERFLVRASGNATSTTIINADKEQAMYDISLTCAGGTMNSFEVTVSEKRGTIAVKNSTKAIHESGTLTLMRNNQQLVKLECPKGVLPISRRFAAGLYVISGAYDRRKGGPQTLPVYDHESFRVVTATVTDLGPETVQTRAGPKSVRHLQLTMGGPAIDWYERGDEHHIVLVVNGITGEVAYRPEFEPEQTTVAPSGPALPNADKYDEVLVSVASYRTTIDGTMFVPKSPGPHPAVVLINGAGQQDRNGDTVGLPRTYMFAILADKLAAAGYKVLRWDDRGVSLGTGKAGDITLKNDKFDAQTMLEWLYARPDVDPHRIAAIGYDAGGVVAPMLAQDDWWLAAVILLAAPSEPMDKVLVEGMTRESTWEAIPAPHRKRVAQDLAQLNKAVTLAKQGKNVTGLPFNAGWLREHMATDPTAALKKVDAPVLIVQPGSDLTVLPRHGEKLRNSLKAAGKKDVTYVVLPGDTHGFTPSPYKNPKYSAAKAREIDPALADLLIRWLGKHLTAH